MLVPADKAPNNTIFICCSLYATVIHTELKSGGAYEDVDTDLDEVIDGLVKQTGQLGLREERALPLLCGLPKMHKNPGAP